MSQDPTQITLRTVLEAVNDVSVELQKFRVEMREFRITIESKLDDMDERLNVLSGDVVKVRARDVRVKRALEQLEDFTLRRSESTSKKKRA